MAEGRSVSTPVSILFAAGALAVILAPLVLIQRTGSSPTSPRTLLTDEQKAYLPAIVVTDTRMSAAQNLLGDVVTYLDARVTNKGPKTIRRLKLELRFVDALNQVVLRETAHPVTPRVSPLKPGETRSFQVSFERLPLEWNQAPPAITPTAVEF